MGDFRKKVFTKFKYLILVLTSRQLFSMMKEMGKRNFKTTSEIRKKEKGKDSLMTEIHNLYM